METNKQTEPVSNRQNSLKEEYTDIFWRLIMHNYAKYKGQEYLNLNEEIKNDSNCKISPECDKRILKSLDKHFRQKKLEKFSKKSKHILSKIAIVFFAFTAVFAITYTSVEAFRVKVLNFLTMFEKEYTSVKLGENEPVENITQTLNNIYAPSYIPDGYKIDNFEEGSKFKKIKYKNAEGLYILFSEYDSTTVANIDTEDADLIKSITINQAEAIFVLKNEKASISWSRDEKIFIISAQLNEETIVRIAESVVFIEQKND